MKHLMTTALAVSLLAGPALADIKLSGYGRTGLVYYEDDGRDPDANETQISSRVRLDVNASVEAEGLTFGANFRVQWDQGDAGVETISPGQLYVTADGFTAYVGNVIPAFDGAALLKQSRLGVFERSWGGDPQGRFFLGADKGYGDYSDRIGLALKYTTGGLTVRASYVDPDQTGHQESGPGYAEETALALHYKLSDSLEFSAATAQNGAGFKGNDLYFVGARYSVTNAARVGLNFIDNGTQLPRSAGTVGSPGNTVTLYGDYKIGKTTLGGYVAHNSGDWARKQTNASFGIGASYDLGRPFLAAGLQRDYDDRLYADMGVRFDF